MRKLPVFDERGGSLVSYVRLDSASVVDIEGTSEFACSLVVVEYDHHVLFGFNVNRRQWELPGGSVNLGESAHDAARRELKEETGVDVESVLVVARAEFSFRGGATTYTAAVCHATLASDPRPVESDELTNFVWWDPAGEFFEGLSVLDAEVTRRCL